jgi:hypothetical protein
MAATTQMMPSTLHDVKELLSASAVAAGKACSGGDNGTVCGEKWYAFFGLMLPLSTGLRLGAYLKSIISKILLTTDSIYRIGMSRDTMGIQDSDNK